jgi:hypothetical protein
MGDFCETIEIIQIIIIFLFITYNNESDKKKILSSDSIYYNFLLNIINYDKITRKNIENNLKDEINKIDNDIFLKNNEYFYIFYNNDNCYVYFFQEKISKKHFIYFNGFDLEKGNINSIINLLINDITYENIEKNLLNKKGIFYKIIDNNVKEYKNEIMILDMFDYLYNNIYNIDKDNKVKLSINGYSLGGAYSQVFIDLLFKKYNNLNIELYNIESWFTGNKKKYDNFQNNIKIYNIYDDKSIFYFYNNIFQNYNKYEYILNNDKEEGTIDKYIKYLSFKSPYGIIKFILDHHILKKIIKK